MDKFSQCISGGKAAPIAMLGVPFDNVSIAETLGLIERMILSRRPHYLVTANVDFLVQAARDVELRRILFDAHLVLCDGTPLVWASRLLGNPLPERVAGSDLVPLLLKLAAEKGYRPFFLGATPDSIETAVEKVTRAYPDLRMAGCYSPPFNRLLEMDHEEIRERILKAQPDLLFVGFGCPKQEKWINMHYRSLGVPVCVGVGGTIDFLAGKLARAPLWMQHAGIEWIYRLAQEPRRLAGRYVNDLWYFGGGILAQYWRLRFHLRQLPRQAHSSLPQSRADYAFAELPSRLDFEEVQSSGDALEGLLNQPKPAVLGGSEIEFIDSTGVGLLIRLQKRARMSGLQLIFANPSEQLLRALRLMRLEEFFVFTASIEEAAKQLQGSAHSAAVHLKTVRADRFPALAWNGELTAANADEVWMNTMQHIAARSLVQRSMTIDLSNLQFIDSTGLSVMIRAKRYGLRQGVSILFAEPRPNVLNVVRLSRLEDYLLKD
jgi:N-acetylglucosaminyldiphosphoundecaprenol N-acetyl-beta-D-mannosaminyltransferase